MKSQNGKIPVPPLIRITFPPSLNLSNPKPWPIGLDRICAIGKSLKSLEVNSPV